MDGDANSMESVSAMFVLLLVATFVVLLLLAPVLGVDSRDGDDWYRHRPVG